MRKEEKTSAIKNGAIASRWPRGVFSIEFSLTVLFALRTPAPVRVVVASRMRARPVVQVLIVLKGSASLFIRGPFFTIDAEALQALFGTARR